MLRRCSSLGACALAIACGPAVDVGDASDSGDGTSSGGATATTTSDSASTTTTAGPTSVASEVTTDVATTATTVEPTATSDGSSDTAWCEDAFNCEPCAPGCENNDHCDDGQWICECICDEGCVGSPAEAFANQSKSPPVACGTAYSSDDAQTWTEVHDCVIDHATQARGFWAEWAVDGDPFGYGVAGAEGIAYAVGWWETSGPGTITAFDCTAVTAIPDCVVAPGEMCLRCEMQAMNAVLCDP